MSKKRVVTSPESKSELAKTEAGLEQMTPEVAQIIRELPESKKKPILQALIMKQSHSGPLPDGDTIKIYSEVIPNGGDRLMLTVEKQLDHRIDMENKGLIRTFNQSSTGQWMGFGIAMFFGLIAWDLARNNHDVAASILGTIDLVALVAVFVTGRFRKK